MDAPAEHYTDVGLGQRMARLFAGRLRYVPRWHAWMEWDSRRWTKDHGTAAERFAKHSVRRMYAEAAQIADDAARAALVAWAGASENASKISAAVRMARSEPALALDHERLDADRWLLNCANGTIDLRTGELRRHRRGDALTKLCPTDYHNDAVCPTWDAFLHRIMAGNDDMVAFLRRAAGYSITGHVGEEVLFFCHGSGANGKSKFLGALQRVLGGDYAMQAPYGFLTASTNERHPTEVADLFGQRFVAAIETEDGKRLAEGLVKQLTGGDRLRARRMNEDFWEFSPSHKLWLASNDKPRISGTDNGIWRRIKLIPFSVTIPERERDSSLADKLAAEASGILAWAVRGCLEWQANGLGEPPQIGEATARYRAEQDVIGEFIRSMCRIETGARVGATELFTAYRNWCLERGDEPENAKKFGGHVRKAYSLQTERGTAGRRFWRGIAVTYPAYAPPDVPETCNEIPGF